MFSSCPIASIIRRHTASPALSPASAAFQHQIGDAPDIDLRDHGSGVLTVSSSVGSSWTGKGELTLPCYYQGMFSVPSLTRRPDR